MTYSPSLTLDTDPHPVFPLYSSGNFAEVAPARLSPIAWSLVGPPVERANRDLVSRLWPSATWHGGSHYVFVGYFACRPYHNLSAYCRIARDVPLVRGQDVAESYFEDVPLPTEWSRERRGRRPRIATIARMLRELAGLDRRVRLLDGRISDLEHSARTALRTGSLLRLGDVFSRSREELTAVWDAHYATTIALVPLRVAQRQVGERLIDGWEEVEPWLIRPSELVWGTLRDAYELDTALGPGEFLGSAFYEVADSHEPWLSLSLHNTVTSPNGGSESRSDDLSGVVWDIHARARLGMLPQITNALAAMLSLRETTKSLAMRCLHVFRTLIPEAARVHDVAAEDWPYLTIGELADGLGGPRSTELARLRRHECELAFESELPELLDFSGAAPDSSAPRARGVSGGSVTGVVVTPATPDIGSDHPRVLVCESADADVQTLLQSVAGIVTARGSALSHIAILAREYGVPAVVGFDGIDQLSPGLLVHIDGATGTVRPLDGD